VNLKAQIPNLITLLNLLSGVLGILWVLEGQLLFGAYFVLLSAGFDFLDGFAARILKVQSEIGKELDSLADVWSFTRYNFVHTHQITNRVANPTVFHSDSSAVFRVQISKIQFGYTAK
jgi:hypothetical protein